MQVYYDTGVLVPLYVEEVFSSAVSAYVESRNEVVALNLFQQLELENALRVKVFRGEIEESLCQAVLNKIKSNLEEGKFALRPVLWLGALEDARRLGAKATGNGGCRTLDLIHVAIAVQWQCAVFVTSDDRQLKAAHSAGLGTVDVRTLGRRDRAGGALREKPARYGVQRKRLPDRV